MPTDTARHPTEPLRFVARAVAGSLAFFAVLRLPWTEAHLLLPATRAQGQWAEGLFGAPTLPVQVTLACSGADVLALCLGAVLAYPVRWRTRLLGAAMGAALVLGLNTLRIGTLGQAVASPGWFTALHLYVWPAVLTLAVAGYVFTWMRFADRTAAVPEIATLPQPTRRFILFAGFFLLLFVGAAPLYAGSAGMLRVGGSMASAAAWVLALAGVSGHAAANVLWTSRGAFIVTSECIATPLIPMYCAAVCAYAPSWRHAGLGALAAVPLFGLLGVIRLLLVALPEVVMTSPTFLVHAFYQVLLGAIVVGVASAWRHGRAAAAWRVPAGIATALVVTFLYGPAYTGAVVELAGPVANDPQGAIALLPVFQVALFLALWVAAFASVGWAYFLGGVAVLGLTHVAGLEALQALGSQADPTLGVRAWAVGGPVLLCAGVVRVSQISR